MRVGVAMESMVPPDAERGKSPVREPAALGTLPQRPKFSSRIDARCRRDRRFRRISEPGCNALQDFFAGLSVASTRSRIFLRV
jgi:hypothetical protein